MTNKLRSKLKVNQFYCFTCSGPRAERSNKNICAEITKNGRYRLRTKCKKCVKNVSKFVTKEVYEKYSKC